MVKKKQNESVATKFSMVLRPRTPTSGKEKVKEKARRKMPVKVDNKVKVKKTVVSGKIKNGNAAKTGNAVKTGNAAKRKRLVDEGNTKVAGSRVKRLKGAMNKKEMGKGVETGSTQVHKLNSGNIKNGNAAKNGKSEKTGNAAKRKLLVDEGNTKVAGSRVKKLKAVMNKNEVDKGAETGSTRVRRLNSGKIKNGNAAKTANAVKTRNAAKRKLLVDEGNTKVAGNRVKKIKAVMKKKEMDKGAETGSTRVHRLNTGKIKNGNAAKTANAVTNGTAAKRKLLVDEANTKVAGSRVKKLEVVINKKEMQRGAKTGSTRVHRLNSAKKGDQSGKKGFKKESAEANTKNIKKVILAKKEASSAIRSPMPKKSLPVKASKRITRKGGMSEDPMSEERANGTIANKIRTNKNNEFIKRKKANVVVTDLVFPPEIITEILSWLPVKFFGIPMVVCKQWYALIQDRHFIEKHMRRNFNVIESNVRQGYMKVYTRDGLRLEMNTSTQKYRILNPDTKQFLELPDPYKGSYHICFAYVPLTL